jgi:hypothetical protein
VHANGQETRIPKNAIDIMMWYPGIEEDIAAGENWATNPKLTPIIFTRTSYSIKVNNVPLKTDCPLYGRLKIGDIVSVFEFAEGSIAKAKRKRTIPPFPLQILCRCRQRTPQGWR